MGVTFTTEVTLSESGFLFDHSTGLTYTLNKTGQFIFKKLREEIEAPAIAEALQEEFDVDGSKARKDLDDFFRQLKDMGIVE
ncbi:HPr-rel-A system PqqD family peptide chaperone [bacterium]|nr:HPr-rel-A system PqqD family peptide chaperone [bacterium]